MHPTSDVSDLNGGRGPFDTAEPDGPRGCAVRMALNAMLTRASLRLNHILNVSDCRVLLAADSATALASSREIAVYVQTSPWLMSRVGSGLFPYGLPDMLYGFRLKVDPSLPPGTARLEADAFEKLAVSVGGTEILVRTGTEVLFEATGCVSRPPEADPCTLASATA